MGFPLAYICSHLSGGAFDCQYTCLNLGDYVSQILDSPTNISWDPMHRLQLSFKDDQGATFITSTVEIITSVTEAYLQGQGYEYIFEYKYNF